jgi:hypothetical protein
LQEVEADIDQEKSGDLLDIALASTTAPRQLQTYRSDATGGGRDDRHVDRRVVLAI